MDEYIITLMFADGTHIRLDRQTVAGVQLQLERFWKQDEPIESIYVRRKPTHPRPKRRVHD